ncbi:MAG: AAA family ATPase [Nitrospirae bacterium]|nr:AAA family ATPase [Nitrospirota bacterium]
MSLKDKAYRLFSYISQVYSIDLPVIRDVSEYKAELWWQADLIHSEQCKIKEFESEGDVSEDEIGEVIGSDAWLSVIKRQYDQPPDLPEMLKDWINLSINPNKKPSPKPSLQKIISFDTDKIRVDAFEKYKEVLREWKASKKGPMPGIPEILNGWLKELKSDDEEQSIIPEQKSEEKFEDNLSRVTALDSYISGQWTLWSQRVLPLFRANELYDQLFSLHQRLSVEGDRVEIIWGHVFLTWRYSEGNTVYHPLIFTSMNLNFDPERRHIFLTPSQTIPTKVDMECLQNLEYPSKDELIKFVLKSNNNDLPPDVWSHNQMRGFASTFTGFISNEPAEISNRYLNELTSKPPALNYPVIYNAPVIVVRERMLRLWVDDAKKIAEAVYNNTDIPPFIKSLIADSHSQELPNPKDYADHNINIDEDEGELLLPKEYNEQQEDVVKKLKNHFGALVQGPPGTGKSHTIANMVSSLLAQGKRVLVTSQTENALKVLRDQIPPEVQSLCVSQLGNDTEAKRQLNEAVDAIGKRLAQKASTVIEQRIKRVKDELRSTREEQANLRNQVKDWVELDASTIRIDSESFSAVQAAKECSENERDYAWFPDRLLENAEPPLNEDEILDMCSLLKEISPEDRKSCAQYLPLPESLLNFEQFSEKILRWKSLSAIFDEAEELRNGWDEKLYQSQYDDIQSTIKKLEEALLSLQDASLAWQQKILEFIILEGRQNDYWQSFLDKCRSLREAAWQAYQSFQGYEIEITQDLPNALDVEAALDGLNRRKPTNFINQLLLSKPAKLIYRSIKVDGHHLKTEERINAVRAYFSYHNCLRKIKTIWGQTIQAVNGTDLTLTGAMPLTEIDEGIKRLCCPIDWRNNYFEDIKNTLMSQGCCQQGLYKQDVLECALKVLNCRLAEIEKNEIEKDLNGYFQFLTIEAIKKDAHMLWSHFASSVISKDLEKYRETFNELTRLLKLHKKAERLEQLSGRLKIIAPLWCASLEKKAQNIGQEALEKGWKTAWRWKRLNEWLNKLHSRESVESLQTKLGRARRKEKELIVELVKERTWQRQIENVKDHHYRALVAWKNAMDKYGKGTGKQAQRWLAAAAKAMLDAVGAVPAWIMPLHRVIQSFPAEPGVFDVIIVDEASQCDLRALSVLFRAKKILVVGDPEQISPSNVGVERDKVFALIQQFLSDVPYKETFYIDNSLYEIAKAIPRMDRTLLTEHFRCVPQIIEFNNHLCPSYAGRLEPLRQPNPDEMLNPPITTVFVNNGFKNNNDVNEPEAEALVDMLVTCCKDERYASGGKNNRKRTMGVVSLLGEKQAKHISDLIAQYIDETEREERKIICGDAYAFQGDERDVMFLSMVIAPNAVFSALTKDSDRQRFNVATSRARDQVFLFHSVRLDDIRNSNCVRHELLNWYLNPPLAEMEAGLEILEREAESEFEKEVGLRIIKRGYKVIPQFKPLPNDFQYRIDLVIQGNNNRLAVECDGDRYHGPDKWEHDQRREAQLRRAGWKFWRISGSTFYRNKEQSLESLWQLLVAEGIEPVLFKERSKRIVASPTDNLKDKPIKEDVKITDNDETEKEDFSPIQNATFTLTPQESQTRSFNRDKIPPLSTNWKVWLEISEWGKKTMSISDYWWGFASDISNRLKEGKAITPKQREHMSRCWKTTHKHGFKAKR